MGEEVRQEQAKAEEKKEEKVEEKKKEKQAEEVKEEPKPPSPLVLYVNLHCVGCAKKLEKSIMKIRGMFISLYQIFFFFFLSLLHFDHIEWIKICRSGRNYDRYASKSIDYKGNSGTSGSV